MSTGYSFQSGGSTMSLHSDASASVLRHSGSQTLRSRGKRSLERDSGSGLTASIHSRQQLHDKGIYSQYDMPETISDLYTTEGASFGGDKPTYGSKGVGSESLKYTASEALLLGLPPENGTGATQQANVGMIRMTSLAQLPPTSNPLVSSLVASSNNSNMKSLQQIPSVAAALQLGSTDIIQQASEGSIQNDTHSIIMSKQAAQSQTRITSGNEGSSDIENINATVGRHHVPVNQLQNVHSQNPLHVGDYDSMQHANMKLRGNMERMISKVKSLQDIRQQQEELVNSLTLNNKFVEHREHLLQSNNSLLMDNQQNQVTRLKAVEADFMKVSSDFELIQKRYALNDAEVERQRKNLAQQYEESTANASRLLNDINGLENQKKELLNKVNGLVKECKTLRERIEGHTQDYTDLNGRYDVQRHETEDLREALEKALFELSSFKDSNHDLQLQLTRSEINYDELRSKLTSVTQEKAMKEKQAQLQIKDLTDKNGNLHESLEKLEGMHYEQGRLQIQKEVEIDRQTLMNTGLNSQVEEQSEEMREQKQELEDTKAQQQTSKHIAAERSSTITLLELKLSGTTAELDESQQLASKLQKEIEYVYRPLEAKERKASSQQKQLQTKFQSAMKTVVALNSELGDLKEHEQSLSDDLEREKRTVVALNTTKQTLSTEVAWLKQTAKQQTTLLKQLQAQVQVMKQKR